MVACAHIASYYHERWKKHKCIAWKVLWAGYHQWANGNPQNHNNLYGE